MFSFRKNKTSIILAICLADTILIGVALFLPINKSALAPTGNIGTIGTRVLGVSSESPSFALNVESISVTDINEQMQTKRVQVQHSLTNKGSTTAQISPGIQYYLFDTAGRPYRTTLSYSSEGSLMGGVIDSGHVKVGQLDFELPLGSDPGTLQFLYDASSEPVVVKL